MTNATRSLVWSSCVTEKLFKMHISHYNSLNVLFVFLYNITGVFWHLCGYLFYTNAHPVSILYSWIVKGLMCVFSCYHQVSDTVLGNGHQVFVLPELISTDTLQL